MRPDEIAVLTLLVNAGIYADETFAPLVRLKALEIAIDTALEIQMTFASVLGAPLK
jgi:hypothetical protein